MDFINVVADYFNKIESLVDKFKRNSNKLVLLITFVFFQGLVLSAFSLVSAQDDANFDSSEIFKTSDDSSTVVTGDENSNIHKLSSNKQASDLMLGAQHLFGTDSFEGASTRADELNLSTYARSGLINTVDGEVTALLYSPPSVAIPQHLARQWVPGSEGNSSFSAFAQEGISKDGYYHLEYELKLESLWGMFRNIAYAGFTIIVVIAGFMIMFRSKIGGQVTVGVMNTLPSVLFGILMVTFSFAIVGFVLDLSKLLLLIIDNLMTEAFNVEAAKAGISNMDFETVGLSGPIGLAKQAFMGTMELDGPKGLLGGMKLLTAMFIPGVSIVTLIVALIVGLASLFAGVKVYITLVMAYIKIILDLVVGPVYILFGSLPGKSSAILGWLKRIVSNALVFPVVFFVLNLARYIGQSEVVDLTGVNDFFINGGEVANPILKLKEIIVIAGYFLASGVPGMISEALDAGDSKGAMGAVDAAKRAASKIPLVGGMFQ